MKTDSGMKKMKNRWMKILMKMDKTLELVMIIIQRIIKSLLMRVLWNDE